MNKLLPILLLMAVCLCACSSPQHRMKNPKKAYYKTGEGKKKQQKYNKQYRGLSH